MHSNTVARGTVVGTSPAGRVSKGATITILVSSGPFTSVVPKVQGDTLAAAQAALQRVHLVSTIQKVGSNAPVGTVVGTNPPAGTTWPQTKTVTILVAAGPPLPNFVGMNYQAAQQWASQHDVNLQQQPDTNSQQPAGIITGQQPAAGTLRPAGPDRGRQGVHRSPGSQRAGPDRHCRWNRPPSCCRRRGSRSR